MLWLLRHHGALAWWPYAILSLGLGVALAWFALDRWRQIHPLRCAMALGLCSGVAGSGAYTLMVYAVVYLLRVN